MSGKVSVLLLTFNQENYIKDCINSILNQSYQNFELLINDDCSTDNTLNIIKEFNDDRIKVFTPKYKKGINSSLTSLCNNASGEFVLLFAGDDILKENHIETTVNYLNEHSEIDTVYVNVTPIDENGKIRKELGEDFCKTVNSTREEQLHQAFMQGNFALSPGMIVRKSVFEKLLPLPCSIVNNQDFKIHIDLLINGAENYILPDKLVYYRFCRNNSNISSRGFITELRESLEFEYVMDSFLKINDIDLLKSIFKNEIEETGIIPFQNSIPYFLGRMALLSSKSAKREWGYHKIVKFLEKEENFDILNEQYNFSYKDLLNLTKEFKNSTFHRYFRYKKLFNNFLVISIILFIALIISIIFPIVSSMMS